MPALIVGVALCFKVVRDRAATSERRIEIARLESDMAGLRAQRADLERFFSDPNTRQVTQQAAFLNGIIDQRSFPWTEFFLDLEHRLPGGVRILSLSPSLSGGQVQVKMRVGALSDKSKLEFLKALEGAPEFSALQLVSEMRPAKTEDADIVLMDLEANYRGEPVGEAAQKSPRTPAHELQPLRTKSPDPVREAVAPHPAQELPSAPVPRPRSNPLSRSRPVLSSEIPKPVADAPPPAFKLPTMSPGRVLEDSLRGAVNSGGSSTVTFGGAIPRGGGGGPISGGGGAGDGYLGGAVQMLTPTQGVDFSGYLNQVVGSTRRKWMTLMPEPAKMGDRGRAVIDFKIMRDGTVVRPDPLLRKTSGKDPLDSAALGAIRGASPFPPLPSGFSGPYIELRFIFLYNLPLEAAK